MATALPSRVVVESDPPVQGAAVSLCFEMCRKNNYNYVVFLDANGCAEISHDELAAHFLAEHEFALMDYVPAKAGFTGKVSGRMWSRADLENAAKAYAAFHRFFPYPPGYEENLRGAMELRDIPESIVLNVTCFYSCSAGDSAAEI